MHRIVPELIIEGYRAGQRRGDLQAAGMFIDLSGFSRITDVLMQDRQNGAEQLTALMYSVFEPLVRSLYEYGGSIVGFAGDGITAIYPAGEHMRAAAGSALAAAWAIQRMLAARPSLETPYGAFPISAKIGLACGEVSWGILEGRDGRKATYYFRGGAVEVSAEAEHHARPGTIVLAKNAGDWLAGLIQGDEAGEFVTVTEVRSELPRRQPVIQQPVDAEIARIFAEEAAIAEGLRGEFRQVVNFMLRIPDLPYEELEDFVAILFDLQARYGGLVGRVDFGDKGCNLLLHWGAPTTYENDIGRALNFAVDLRARAAVPITAGITSYTAHAGYVGSALAEDYTCNGWGTNLAARFMMGAENGDMWVDERVMQRGSRTFEMEYLGEQRFKGFADEQKVYKLIGRKADADAFYPGALAGREAELKELAEAVKPLWGGSYAGVTVIQGEAGIGKSRLLHEFKATEAAKHEATWALCPADPILRQSLNPFRYWVHGYFGGETDTDDASRLRSLHATLDNLIADITDESLIQDLQGRRSFLAALIDLRWADSPYERMDAQGRYDNTLLALTSLLKAESRLRPVVVMLEDAHFLDDDSKAFLSRLKRTLTASSYYPIAIVMTARQDESGSVIEDGFADHLLELRGLPPDAMMTLSQEVLGRPAAPSLIQFLERHAEGNPFFAEQILRYLWEESLIGLDRSVRWVLQPGWQASVLPADVTTMLIARLDRLVRRVRDVVQTASVLGREFEIRVLGRMLNDHTELAEEMAQAEQVAIWSPLDELRYLFRHALLRDAAYSMQMEAHRRELHALALEALESLYSDEAEFHYPELAYHSEKAMRADKARLYLRLAAEAARDAYQNVQAIDFYSRVLKLVPVEETAERFALLKERVLLYRRLGDRKSEAADLDRLNEASREGDSGLPGAWVSMLRAEYALTTGDYLQAVDCARQATNLAGRIGDVEVMLGARLILPSALQRQGKLDEAMREAQEALQMARNTERPAEQGAALNLMGLIALDEREITRARGYFEQVLTLARAHSDRTLEWKALNNLGISAGGIDRDYEAAREYYRQAYAIVHERGDRPAEVVALGNLGWVAGAQGDFNSARAYQDQTLAIAREVGDPYQVAYTLINLSGVAGLQGDAHPALQYALEAETLASRIGDRSGQAWALLYKGHAYLLDKDFEHAEEAFQASVAIREELQQAGLAAEPLAGLVQAALERGDLSAASRWTDRILAHLERGGTLDGTEEPLRIYLACYRALEIQGDPRARTVLRVARKMLNVQLSKFRDDEARRMYVENVPWRLAVQQAARDAGRPA